MLTPAPIESSASDVDEIERILHMARRLVCGLLIHLDASVKPSLPSSRVMPGCSYRVGPPTHRVVFVGRPISVDCRPDVRGYIRGTRHAAPAVQTLVRGHYKRQVIGIDRAGRKMIWIQPYWRGPEDAPILTHVHTVGG